MATHVSRVPHSKLLRAAGVVSLVAAFGHVQSVSSLLRLDCPLILAIQNGNERARAWHSGQRRTSFDGPQRCTFTSFSAFSFIPSSRMGQAGSKAASAMPSSVRLFASTLVDSVLIRRAGLNYLRLAKIQPSSFDMLDRLTVLFQALMHLYTLVGLTQPPPRAISAIILSCIGGGLLGA